MWGDVVRNEQNRYPSIVVFLFISILIAGFIFLFQTIQDQINYKFIVPTGYHGWIEVVFDQPEYPPLERERRQIIVEVPANGMLKTSSSNKSGSVELYYMDSNEKLVPFPINVMMIHGLGTSSSGMLKADGSVELTPEKLRFYVGTIDQWQEEELSR